MASRTSTGRAIGTFTVLHKAWPSAMNNALKLRTFRLPSVVKRPPQSMPAKTAWLTRGVAETMWMLMEKRTTGICTTPYEGGNSAKKHDQGCAE
ncbi:hypothetical protein V4C85_17745 [Ralstonia solanacearum]|uniref:hypothetical protein n=1 Tax=Ralstonia solanacearum TaxID=305 RepID=UPI0007D826CA|nr:hypothetical protein [Ralstonia solanacearum]MBB6592482.1 hypothetical protein [Ralstonia solanacearum]MBB6596707.1 hypothetical protein [Ralstonia solanacearum]MDB0558732.1 hypothetical protein [Ralstonia solanacearum]OAI58876.1 hypothetical protein RSP597_24710 [Ralstonia solanacearum]